MINTVIYKYTLKTRSFNEPVSVEMRQGAIPLSCALQDGLLQVWALVPPSTVTEEMELQQFFIANTGGIFLFDPGTYRFLSTVQLPLGLVAHVFWMEAAR